ncbi:unnamed protein product [Prorocentrum cordatum]|uniref:Cyclin-dependent kinase 2 homolog n=1 Tax=Prorocentrum cordatum TaxID=2364126 RepID=A0ABN9WWH1_9DINO|nr:unnamed protein product [Polarella glacialis]
MQSTCHARAALTWRPAVFHAATLSSRATSTASLGGYTLALLAAQRSNRSQSSTSTRTDAAAPALSTMAASRAGRRVHRDLKPQNLLVHPVHGLKICDFGLARAVSTPSRAYTPEVITLWYRCLELLLGRHTYGAEVDIWSAGCIVAEMAAGHAIFPGDCEIGTCFKIMQLLGSPTEATWPGFEQMLPHWSKSFPTWPASDMRVIRDARPEFGEAGIDLLRSLLSLNPASRPTARRARAHALFSQPGPAA